MRFAIQSGVLVPLLLMVPNVAWMLSPSTVDTPQRRVSTALAVAENLGRGAVLALPLFYSLNLQREYSVAALAAILLSLGVYYAAWIRYFASGRSVELLNTPLLGIPLPLAVAPIVLFVVSSYLMNSWLMLAASVYFGVLHVWVSSMSSGVDRSMRGDTC